MSNKQCSACGMPMNSPAEYHPFVACRLFMELRSAKTVRDNLRAVVEYGMKAHTAGVSLDEAMSNIVSVRAPATDDERSQ